MLQFLLDIIRGKYILIKKEELLATHEELTKWINEAQRLEVISQHYLDELEQCRGKP